MTLNLTADWEIFYRGMWPLRNHPFNEFEVESAVGSDIGSDVDFNIDSDKELT